MPTNRGITIIETMVALFLLALMGAAIITLTLQMIAANNSAKIKNQAVAYVQEALEQARGRYQINSWLWLSQRATANCYTDGNFTTGGKYCINTFSPACDGSQGTWFAVTGGYGFYRAVEVTTVSPQVKVTATIAWKDRDKCLVASDQTYYYNY